mmetsp:Transcript_21802/g.19332  ORF Transcript_21802/g.19332 Transcript_21802/m.19332 type:complete len:199 (+) Transcript_21802:1-597(+)
MEEYLSSDKFVGYKMKFKNLNNKRDNKRERKSTEDEIIEHKSEPDNLSTGNTGYRKPYKRMRIEDLFSELSINDGVNSDKNIGDGYKHLEEPFQDSQCFSIEIHKIQNVSNPSEGDILPRRRKKAKGKKRSRKNSENDAFDNGSMTTSETGSSKKSPINDQTNFSESWSTKTEINPSIPCSEGAKSEDEMISIEIEDK